MDYTSSDLAKIEDTVQNPFELFEKWLNEAENNDIVMPRVLCLSTVDSNGHPHARNLILRKLEKDSLVIMSDRQGRKYKEMQHIPNVAVTFLWIYKNKDNEIVSKQVRFEGVISELDKKETNELYENEPLFCKIRAHVCNQDEKVEWEDQKKKHDQLLRQVLEEKKPLPVPDHFVAFKIRPSYAEFYYAHGNTIADRIVYEKQEKESWTNYRVAA